MITEPSYVELLKSCTNWNHQISKARSKRGPFLDCQTAIAQKPSHLYRSSWDRIEEEEGSDRVYSWPAWRWKKRKKELNSGDSNELINSDELLNADPHKMPGLENPGMRQDDAMISSATAEATKAPFQESVYIEYDELSDDFDEIEEQSDGDDYEEYSSKRRRGGGIKRGSGTGRKRRAAPLPSYTTSSVPISQPTSIIQPPPMPPPPPPSINDKPYCCLQCGAKYKSKPGLNYHLAHVHNEFSEYQRTPTAAAVPAAVDISHFCDFCLGDATENKKTGQPEELVSCHDCGRSGHPTCLNFTSNMIISTKKYGWQCIECKSCAICGTSENDDQLLFCDDCDRGFHLYCLNPPLSAPPEGEWSCHLCQVEFGPNASQPATGGQYGTAPINK